MKHTLDHDTDTTTKPRWDTREQFVRRRFLFVFLPLIAFGAGLYIAASAATLTANGLSLLGVGVAGLAVVAAAWDAGERR